MPNRADPQLNAAGTGSRCGAPGFGGRSQRLRVWSNPLGAVTSRFLLVPVACPAELFHCANYHFGIATPPSPGTRPQGIPHLQESLVISVSQTQKDLLDPSIFMFQ